MKYDVFISYSRKDSEVAKQLCEALTRANLSFFIDKSEIPGGSEFTEEIAKALEDSAVFLLLASESAYNSKFVKAEILYAFNHKRSGTILPYLIDNAQMPQNLELLLGSMNQFNSREHPMEPALIDAIRYAISHPDTGTIGGRKVMHKWQKLTLGIVAALILAGLVFYALSQRSSKSSALEDLSRYEAILDQSDALVQEADRMKNNANTLETTDDQIACLKQARALLDSSDAVKAVYAGTEFIGLFNQDRAAREKQITARLDSMHAAWVTYAKDSHALYRITRSESDAQNTLDCIRHALAIQPDQELESIKESLNKI